MHDRTLYNFKPGDINEPWSFHGNLVTNLAGGKQYGAAPEADIVLVNRIPSTSFDMKGVEICYDAILDHYNRNRPPRGAIVNMSQGSFQDLQASVDAAIFAYHMIDKLIQAGICVVSAAGNDPVSAYMCDLWHLLK